MKPRQTGQWAASLLALVLISAACGSGTDEAEALNVVAGQATPTPIATTAPLAIPTATPTPIPVLRAAAPAVAEAAPIATALPAPTSTPTDSPTAAPIPVLPAATAIPEPTATAEPVATAEPTATPEPTASASAPAATSAVGGHNVTNLGHVTLGQAGAVSLVIPVANVELVGFHQASHPGSQAINAAGTGLSATILESRSRGTALTSAADIVVPPGEPVRAPATGTVIASSTYVLYCEHVDQLVYIEPDGLPGWVVRVFHVQGATPAVGTRVIAGETLIADGPRQLPFESQIDEFTAEPSWPHVHVEVVDTSVPDTRPPGPGCP